MSSNNQLRIDKYGSVWRVSEVDVDGAGGHFIQVKPFTTLELAIEAANEYMKENIVEYGLDIVDETK